MISGRACLSLSFLFCSAPSFSVLLSVLFGSRLRGKSGSVCFSFSLILYTGGISEEKSQRQSANLTIAVFIFTNLIPEQFLFVQCLLILIEAFRGNYCVSKFVEKSGSVCFPYSLIPFFSLSLLTSTCVFWIKHALKITDDTSKHSLSVCACKWNGFKDLCTC